jgi:hypothetical protein
MSSFLIKKLDILNIWKNNLILGELCSMNWLDTSIQPVHAAKSRFFER